MTPCDEPAHWDLSARKIIVCYELAADFGNLYTGYAVEAFDTDAAGRRR